MNYALFVDIVSHKRKINIFYKNLYNTELHNKIIHLIFTSTTDNTRNFEDARIFMHNLPIKMHKIKNKIAIGMKIRYIL